jgi:pilus assembly protein FimV
MKRAVRRALLLSALAAPSALYALGLGEIRLNSALNQPFDAEIELVSAAPEDLAELRAALASGDAFQRYGIDKPAYLSDFMFRVARSGGRDVLRITSPRPVTEPFVTLLVEASWPRGRLLREYTVLLDPPLYAAAPVATPRASTPPPVVAVQPAPPAPPAAAPEPPAPQPRAPQPARPERPRAVIEPGSTYRVRPNDTLWQIASTAHPGTRADVNRAMVAIYQANPAAFGGNINVLRAGSDLRIPTSGDLSAISAAAAADEVARQYRLWTSGQADTAAPAAEAAGRLRLVTPEQGTPEPAPAVAPAPQPAAGTSTAELQQRLERLETELAETRRLLEVRSAELATLQGATTPAPAEPGAEPATPVTPVPDATPGEAEPQPTQEPEAATPPPKPEPEPRAEPERKPEPPPAAEPGPSLFERLREYWWALLLPLLAGLGIAAWLRRRRAAGESPESLEEALGRQAGDLRGRAAPAARGSESDILVEERQPVPVGLATAGAATATAASEPTRRPVMVEDTLSGDGAVSIEASDPLAEADFHMAYGLYDQAADLVQLAAKREPQRRDLKLKLIEIFFVWGNRERFLALAREMHATRGEAEPGEWDKILIMGRQLAPEAPLFAGAQAAAPGGGLDLELHAGAPSTDFELPDGEAPRPDLDLTMVSPEVRSDDGIDFLLDEPVRGGGADDSSLAPTVETPRPRVDVDEQTAEVALEDLGLDTSALDDLSRIEKTLDISKPDIEDTVQEPVRSRGAGPGAEDGEDLLSATSLLRTEVGDLSKLDSTSIDTPVLDLSKLDSTATDTPVVDLSKLDSTATDTKVVDFSDATGELPTLRFDDLEATGEMERPQPRGEDDSTMGEVGTKLDLARAYVDMGDPEGARSILEEVLKEGDAAHRQEAQRLLAGLP